MDGEYEHGVAEVEHDSPGYSSRPYRRPLSFRALIRSVTDTDKNMRTKDLLIKYARDPENASIFNYASMLYNTHFFFDGLNSTGTPIPPSESLAREIMNSFSTPAALRTDFLTTAHSMFGPGFIWLVRVIESDQKQTAPVFKILPTYLAGSPYAGAHYRQQSSDQNTQARDAANRGLSAFDFQRQHIVQNNVGFLGPMSRGERRVSKGGVEVNPVLCVSTWEHMWLRQFGISGKGRYLNAFWDKINWRVVENRMKANDYS